ncbi:MULTISPECIES: hypothetical protein [Wolbachia]|uniref:hypothetical protein n=1 Tax=Wolbachia TaxID=953 RepID=UPI00221F7833|nr:MULTISPECIES: hypothetical protein [Wolbachia]BDG75770.1 hypothetical protein wHmt_03280 [Wolbachia pipientis]BDG77232.1 hypothetical protein wHmc_03640 [Wolbachia pipientis]
MTSITGTKFFLKRSKGKKGAKMEDFFWDFWPTVDEEVRKERYCLASQQKNYSSCIIKSKNTSDCVTVHRLQLVNMLNGLEAFFDFKLQSTS